MTVHGTRKELPWVHSYHKAECGQVPVLHTTEVLLEELAQEPGMRKARLWVHRWSNFLSPEGRQGSKSCSLMFLPNTHFIEQFGYTKFCCHCTAAECRHLSRTGHLPFMVVTWSLHCTSFTGSLPLVHPPKGQWCRLSLQQEEQQALCFTTFHGAALRAPPVS